MWPLIVSRVSPMISSNYLEEYVRRTHKRSCSSGSEAMGGPAIFVSLALITYLLWNNDYLSVVSDTNANMTYCHISTKYAKIINATSGCISSVKHSQKNLFAITNNHYFWLLSTSANYLYPKFKIYDSVRSLYDCHSLWLIDLFLFIILLDEYDTFHIRISK